MSLDDLREHGVVLPEDRWGTHSLRTTVPTIPALAAFLAAAAGLALALAGDGRPLTFTGVALFLAAFFALTWISDRAVRAQRRRVRDERERARGARGSRTRTDS